MKWVPRTFPARAFLLAIFLVLFDTVLLRRICGLGYPRSYEEENVLRYPAPYVMFTGKPLARGHDAEGFLGPPLRAAGRDALTIAFFSGSTGYRGNPPIPEVLRRELARILGTRVFVANYSVVSSNHRQHLHALIEHLPQHRPDIVVFYGGYNETIQGALYDPRPGYPFNFFFREETGTLAKLLIENSALIGEIDMRLGLLTGLRRLQLREQPMSRDWNSRVREKYIGTLGLASRMAGTMDSRHCGRTRFLAFYQPYRVPPWFAAAHEDIRSRLRAWRWAFDVSSEFDGLGPGVFTDSVHVKQEANELMGRRLAAIIARELRQGALAACRFRSPPAPAPPRL